VVNSCRYKTGALKINLARYILLATYTYCCMLLIHTQFHLPVISRNIIYFIIKIPAKLAVLERTLSDERRAVNQ